MMLKIKMDKEIHWFVTDNVKDIDYYYLDEKEAQELYDANRKQEVPVRWIDNYGELLDKRMALMTVRFKDKPDELIFTDSTIYILNDEGKTCDSLGVYN